MLGSARLLDLRRQRLKQACFGGTREIENTIANRQTDPVRTSAVEDSKGKILQREIASRIVG